MGKKNYKYFAIYMVMFAIVLFMIVWVSVRNSGDSLIDELSEGRTEFDEGWVLSDGSAVDMAHLSDITEPYVITSVYHTIPSDLEEGYSLCFRTKNICYEVYVDGELRYSPDIKESAIYNKSYGTRWSYILLYSKDAGKQVEIRFYTVYESARACVDNLYIGFAAGEILSTFSEKSVAIVTCMLLLFASVLLIIADIPINVGSQKNHELLYLGLFSLCVSIWSLAESNILQYFINDSRMLQIISCCSLMLISIPLMLYLDEVFGFHFRFIVPVVSCLSAAEFIICMILHFCGIMDFHQTLTFSHVMLGISAVILVITIIENAFSKKTNSRGVFRALRAIGFISIAIAAVMDIIRYYRGNGNDTAMCVRIGLLIFILCYGFSSLEKTINAVKLGVQSEFISQLAYKDGLTGIGNRTAFEEKISELENVKDEVAGIAIVMFDVNDLKPINDNLGHQKGDEMLVGSAGIIKQAWEAMGGSCYRVGGDEFAVILDGEDIQSRCEEGMKRFAEGMREFNEKEAEEKGFRISIASDYAVYNKNRSFMKLDEVYQQADKKMYANKKKIKAMQNAETSVIEQR